MIFFICLLNSYFNIFWSFLISDCNFALTVFDIKLNLFIFSFSWLADYINFIIKAIFIVFIDSKLAYQFHHILTANHFYFICKQFINHLINFANLIFIIVLKNLISKFITLCNDNDKNNQNIINRNINIFFYPLLFGLSLILISQINIIKF